MKSPIPLCAIILTVSLSAFRAVSADSATWNTDPISDDWNTAANWSPPTVPNGPLDIASFAVSSQTNITLSAGTEVAEMSFLPGASHYTFSVGPGGVLAVVGSGISNVSAVGQNFAVTTNALGEFGLLSFRNAATAGDQSTYLVYGARSATATAGAQIIFHDTSTAGTANFSTFGGADAHAYNGVIAFRGSSGAGAGFFLNNGSTVDESAGGRTEFYDSSNAGSATFLNKAMSGVGGGGGQTIFYDHSDAGNATFVNEPATLNGFNLSGFTYFYSNSNAGNATLMLEGATIEGGEAGTVYFDGNASAGNATITCYPAIRGTLGGLVIFADSSTGGTARFKLLGVNTRIDLDFHPRPLTLGSIEGDGQVLMQGCPLSVGSNNEDTVFSGEIIGYNSLTKVGTGQLTLSGANSYTGNNNPVAGTIVSEGTLLVTNKRGSATGRALVLVRGGKLSGTGIIAGPIRVDSVISAGDGAQGGGVLTTRRSLTIEPTGTYEFVLNTDQVTASQIVADNVLIAPGAQFVPTVFGTATITVGTVFTAIGNTSENPIAGTFGNLADGSIITIGNNNFQANYEGGDGNDLTLTVVP